MSYETVNGLFTGIADAIRSVDGTVDPIAHQDMPTKISGIPAAFTGDATAAESDILLGKTAYVDGEKKTGTSTLNADTTDATLTANDMLYGVTGYGADGTKLTGAGAYWQYVRSISSMFANRTGLPAYIELYLPLVFNASSMFRNTDAVSVKLTFSSTLTNIVEAFRYTSTLTTLEIRGDISNSAISSNFITSSVLENVVFDANVIKFSASFSSTAVLTTASLLSIANALNTAADPKVLTMHATATTNMGAIMVDNNAGVAELGSSMTLTQFINNIKGWTIA
jgi:hypothetical protein